MSHLGSAILYADNVTVKAAGKTERNGDSLRLPPGKYDLLIEYAHSAPAGYNSYIVTTYKWTASLNLAQGDFYRFAADDRDLYVVKPFTGEAFRVERRFEKADSPLLGENARKTRLVPVDGNTLAASAGRALQGALLPLIAEITETTMDAEGDALEAEATVRFQSCPEAKFTLSATLLGEGNEPIHGKDGKPLAVSREIGTSDQEDTDGYSVEIPWTTINEAMAAHKVVNLQFTLTDSSGVLRSVSEPKKVLSQPVK